MPILGIIPLVGFLFVIAGFLCTLFAISKLSNKVGSPTLKKNYILYIVITPISLIGIGIAVFTFFGMNYGYGHISGIGIIVGVASITGIIYGLFKEFQVYKELSNISGDIFFLYYFIGTIVGALTTFIVIGYIFLVVAFVLQIVAWYRLQDVKIA